MGCSLEEDSGSKLRMGYISLMLMAKVLDIAHYEAEHAKCEIMIHSEWVEFGYIGCGGTMGGLLYVFKIITFTAGTCCAMKLSRLLLAYLIRNSYHTKLAA